jgi:hypothetical protein
VSSAETDPDTGSQAELIDVGQPLLNRHLQLLTGFRLDLFL